MLGVSVLRFDDGSDIYYPRYTGLSEPSSSVSVADSDDFSSFEGRRMSYHMTGSDYSEKDASTSPHGEISGENSIIYDNMHRDKSELEPVLFCGSSRKQCMGVFKNPEFGKTADALSTVKGSVDESSQRLTFDNNVLRDVSDNEEDDIKESSAIILPPLSVVSATTVPSNATNNVGIVMATPSQHLRPPQRSISQINSRHPCADLSYEGSSTFTRLDQLSRAASPLSCRLSYGEKKQGMSVTDIRHWVMKGSIRRHTIPRTQSDTKDKHDDYHSEHQIRRHDMHSVNSTDRRHRSVDVNPSVLVMPFMTTPSPLMTRRMTLWPRDDFKSAWRRFSQSTSSSSRRSSHHTVRTHKPTAMPDVMSGRLPLLRHDLRPQLQQQHVV